MLCYASKILRLNSVSEQKSVSMGGLRSLFRISSKSDRSGSVSLGGLGTCVPSALSVWESALWRLLGPVTLAVRPGLCKPAVSADCFLFLSLG